MTLKASQEPRSLVVVAPTFNEEELIGEFLARVSALAARINLKGIVIVDDGSEDRTVQRIRAFAETQSEAVPLRLVRLSRNFGHQRAVLAGLCTALEWAERGKVDFIGLIDADLQDRPEHFVDLMDRSVDHDIVYAQRTTRAEGAIFKILASHFYKVLSATARHPIPGQAGTFCVMRRVVVRAIVANADSTPYFPGLRAWVGFRQGGVALPREARKAGNSRVGFGGLFALGLNAIFSYSDLPVRAMTVFAASILAISALSALTMAGLKIAGLVEVQGTALIVVSIFFSLGVQSVYLLVIAYMLRRLESESSRRRSYIIMEDEELSK